MDLLMEHPLPMWVVDTALLRFLDVNPAAERTYGYTREQFLHMRPGDLLPADQRSPQPLLPDAEVHARARALHVTAAGRMLEVEQYAQRITYRNDAALLITVVDVSGLRTARCPEEGMLRSVSDQLPDVVFVKDREGRYVFVNQASAALLGRPAGEIIGRLDSDFSSPEATAGFRAADAEAMAASEPTIVHEWVRYGEREAFMQTRKAAWRDEQGTVRGVIGIARDLTELKRAERELHDIQQRYRIAFEHAPIGMALAAVPSGRWLYVNEAMCRITGYSADELSQLGFHDLTHPDDLPATL
ncbi:MAG TPA: PAS domain S-box protein, partial [Burkholderiales bacterium]|nr:PAS domain S-box protein [Burkholderiales bacterium]